MEKQEQDAIFLDIFTSCDVQNTENVCVSVLMNFLAPFIGTNSEHVEELQRLLNATNTAPVIDKTTFLNVMELWTEKCKNVFEVNEPTSEDAVQLNSNSTTNLDNSDTVTENFDRDLNISNVSGYSLTGSTISSTETINWQEMNRELQHNNKKLNESLVDVRNQVSTLEEQNESLHSSLAKLNKCRQSDQTLIKTLQKKCSDLERDHEDNANITNKHLNTIQKLASSKKELGQLQIRIEELEQETKQYAETITDHQNLVSKEKNTNQYLQSEVEQRDLVITEFQDKQIELKRQISNLEFTTKQYMQENEHLQEKVQSLELQIEKSIKNNIALQSEGSPETGISSTPIQSSHLNKFKYSRKRIHFYTSPVIAINRTYNQNRATLHAEPTEFDISTESALPSEKQINNSLSPEELFWGRPSSPHENLHSELIKIGDTNCLISCEHKQRLNECKEEAEKVVMELYTKNNSAKSEILQIEEQLSNAKKFSAKLIKKNSQCKRRLKFFKSSLLQNISQCKEKSKELEELKSELGKIKNEQEELNQMAVENEQLVFKVGMLSDENNELKKEINPKKTKIEQLELKLHQDRKHIFDYKQKNEHCRQEIENLNDRIENLKINNQKLNNEYESLHSHVKTASQIIKDSRGFLKMNTLLTTDIWKTVIKMLIPDQNIEEIINISILNNDVQNIKGPLQEEIIFLNNEIRQTVNILKALAKIRKKMKVSTATGSSPTSDLKCLLNFRNNAKSSDNESIFSKLTPKRFFLKHPSSSTPRNSPFIPPSSMSPECSASDMTDTASGTTSESTVFIETNNNEIPLIMAQKEEEPVAYQNGGLSSEKNDEIVVTTVSRENDSVRINDSKIEAILKEHRLQEPLEKIEESILLSPEEDTENNSGYKSDSALEISENGAHKGTKKKLKKGVRVDLEENVREKLARKYRSMSEGAVISHQLLADGDVVVFPNLKSETLDAMGLLPNGQPKERLTDEEIEQKFQLLTLAFAIDAVTLGDRLERQHRQRDQAEDNLTREVTKFIQAVHRLNPLCVDAETTELVTSLLGHLDLIVQATHRISTSAEIFGNVQLEWRISDSVNMMISHLRNVIQQRDTTRRQLQCTKHMLQESATSAIGDPQASSTPRRSTLNTITAPVVGRTTRRRASIATIPRPLDSPSASGPAGLIATAKKAVARRVSAGVCGERVEPSSRHLDFRSLPEWKKERLSRPSLSKRPSRLEFGLDLSKIQEGSIETTAAAYEDPMDSGDETLEFRTPSVEMMDSPFLANASNILLQNRVIRNILQHVGPPLIALWNRWVEDGTINEICCLGACFCFAMATFLLCNLVVEIEFAKAENVLYVPWKWLTWDELWSIIFTIEKNGPCPI